MADRKIVYTTGGTVQSGGGVYISRSADAELLARCREGAFSFVLTARQMGKSSLMVRTVEQLRKIGTRSAILDLTTIGAQVSAEQWYLGLLLSLEEQLELPGSVIDWWRALEHLGMAQRLIQFLRAVLLAQVPEPVVIFVDEIDTTLSLDFTDDFFAAIRYLYNARATEPPFRRISFVLLGVASPTDLIHDAKRTPFNLGHRVDLTDFTFEEALPLADGLSEDPAEAQQVLRWAMKWTGGHPYLTQRLCRTIAEERLDLAPESPPQPWTEAEVDEIVNRTFFGRLGEQDHNLQFVRNMLLKGPDPLEAIVTYRRVLERKLPVRDDEQSIVRSHLKLSGIVRLERGELRVRNPVYAHVFDLRWVKEHLPVNWRKRFKQVAIGSVVALAALVFWVIMLSTYQQQTERALMAQKQASEAQKQLSESNAKALAARTEANDCRKVNEELQESNRIQEEERVKAQQAMQKMWKVKEEYRRLALHLAETPFAERVVTKTAPQFAVQMERAINLANQADNLRKTRSDLLTVSLLLAAEAIQIDHSTITDLALRQGLQLLPRVTRLSGTDAFRDVAFGGPGGAWVATGDDQGKVCFWNPQTGKPQFCMPQEAPIQAVATSADGQLLASLSEYSQFVHVYDARGVRKWRLRHEDPVTALAFTPNGRFLVTSADRVVWIWDIASGKPVDALKHTSNVRNLAISRNGQYVATSSEDGVARVWELTNPSPGKRTPKAELPHGTFISSLAFSPDSASIATAGEDRLVRLWSFLKGRSVTLPLQDAPVSHLDFSPDGRFLATVSREKTAYLWNVETLEVAYPLYHEEGVRAVKFSPSGETVATFDEGKMVSLWHTHDGLRYARLPHEGPLRAMAFNPEGTLLATASNDRVIRVWKMEESRAAKIVHDAPVKDLAVAKNGQFLATTSLDNTARIWSAAGTSIAELIEHQDDITGLEFSHDGKLLVTASADNTARIWESASGTRRAVLSHPDSLQDVAFSPDDRWVATASRDKTACLWDTATGTRGQCFTHRAPVNAVAFDPAGKWLATASRDKRACVWNVATGEQVTCVTVEDWVNDVVFSPDGKFLVTASRSKTVEVWDVSTWKRSRSLLYSGSVQRLLFNDGPDTKFLAIWSPDNAVYIWDLMAEQPVVLKDGSADYRTVAFSPDGKYVATGGNDKTVRIWEATSGRPLARIAYEASINAVRFSANGSQLIIAADRAILTTPWRPQDLVAEACSRLEHNLSRDDWKSYLPGEPYHKTCDKLP